VRLTDGSGVGICQETSEPKRILKEVPVDAGVWTFRILNHAAIGLRCQPIDRCGEGDMLYKALFTANKVVKCDRRVASSTAVNFYRVQGTQGWALFDKRGGQAVMEHVVHSNELPTVSSPVPDAWSIDSLYAGLQWRAAPRKLCTTLRAVSFRFEPKKCADQRILHNSNHWDGNGSPISGKNPTVSKKCTCQELADISFRTRGFTPEGAI
jgi:hypothetical protein